MKKKLLGLGVCALALGVVAGAVSARSAIEADAATKTTVYLAISDAARNGYTVKLNVNYKGDGDDWHSFTMADTGKTVDSVPVYSATFTDAYDGLGCLQFQLYDGDTWKEQDEVISSWTGASTYNGKLHVYKGSGWADPEFAHDYVIRGLSGWDLEDATAMEAAGESGYVAKKELALAANAEFKLYDSTADDWFGGSGFYATDATRAKFKVLDDGNLKALVAGTYKIYLRSSGLVEILFGEEAHGDTKAEPVAADGYYILGLDTWRAIYGIADDKDGESTNYAEFHNVVMGVGQTFKVVDVKDNAGKEYYGYGSFEQGARYQYNDMTGKIGIASTDPEHPDDNFKVLVAGTYNVFLFDKDGDKKISIVQVGYTDQDAVDAFVADLITPEMDDAWKTEDDPDVRSASCKAKYDAAHAALIALPVAQQTLFSTNDRYAAEYAAYLTWEAVAGGTPAMNVSTMTNGNNSALIITLVAIAGAAVLGMGVYFASRKRKSK